MNTHKPTFDERYDQEKQIALRRAFPFGMVLLLLFYITVYYQQPGLTIFEKILSVLILVIVIGILAAGGFWVAHAALRPIFRVIDNWLNFAGRPK